MSLANRKGDVQRSTPRPLLLKAANFLTAPDEIVSASAGDGRRLVQATFRAQETASIKGLEVVFLKVVGDLAAEHGSLGIGGAEVDAGPHSSVDNFVEDVREPLEVPCSAGFVAERADGDLVRAEKVLERVHERTCVAGVPRWMIREGRRCERRRVAD
jgi:hypothetical protein